MKAIITPENVKADFRYISQVFASRVDTSLTIPRAFNRHKLFLTFSIAGASVRFSARIRFSLGGMSILELPYRVGYSNQINLRVGRNSASGLTGGTGQMDYIEGFTLQPAGAVAKSNITVHYFSGHIDKAEIITDNVVNLTSASVFFGVFSDMHL